SRTGGGINPTIQSDSLSFTSPNGVPQLTGFPGLTGPITDAIDNTNPDIDTPVSTTFNITVTGFVNTPTPSRIDNLSLDRGISHEDLKQLDAKLIAPTGQTIHLFLNRTNEAGQDFTDGRGLEGKTLFTTFADGAPFPVNQGAEPYLPFWQPEE